MTGGQKRGRTQRRHFKQSRENVWKYKKEKTDGADDANGDSNPKANPSWQPFSNQNHCFEEYYKEQCIVSVEEWDEFISILRNPLPSAFRINSSGQFFKDIRTQLEEDFMKSLKSDKTSKFESEAIRPLAWYPDNLAWHLNFSRMQLRKNQALERFHEFLKQENEIGNITRQEAVSMVPPLFLDVLPNHHVLDMCAAPGSKTFQLLELMHNSAEPGSMPRGLVIANDVDVQRCNLLIHQTKRMCTTNLIVTNHEAQHFPTCQWNNSLSEIYSETGFNNEEVNDTICCEEKIQHLLFDRVLCDVPCSGDGTLRKAPDIWRKWHPGMGNGLHNLQVQIAMRGLNLLKVGGRMVYSTCSMNPVENEAVVSEILSRCGESIELLDVSSEFPELVRRPGLKKWKVRDKGLWMSSYKDVPVHRKSTILPSMFPAGRTSEILSDGDNVKEDAEDNILVLNDTDNRSADAIETNRCASMTGVNNESSEEVSSFPLDRCIRIVPHDQNTGAFFIAVFQKLDKLPVVSVKNHHTRAKCFLNARSGFDGVKPDLSDSALMTENILKNVPDQIEAASSDADMLDGPLDAKEDDGANTNYTKETENEMENTPKKYLIKDENKEAVKGRSQIQGQWKGIDPIVFFEDGTSLDSIKTFYGISPLFHLDGQLVSRNEDSNHVKRIYYVSKSVQEVLKLNFRVGQRLKIASLGLKLFERQALRDASSCAFRISSEGLPLILPYVSKQIVHAPMSDFHHLLKYRNVKFADLVDADFREKTLALLSGCCVVVLRKEQQQLSNSILVGEQTIAIVCWKGKNSLSILLSEVDGRELLERLIVRLNAGKPRASIEDETPIEEEAPDIIPQQVGT